jgi:hypothetical protein
MVLCMIRRNYALLLNVFYCLQRPHWAIVFAPMLEPDAGLVAALVVLGRLRRLPYQAI